MTVHDPSKVTASGDGLKHACVGEVAWFEIDPHGPATAEAEVKITSPSGTRVATTISRTTRGIFRVEFTPTEVGPHKIACKYADTPLTGSPFICEAYDPKQVNLKDINDGFVGKESVFRVDTTMAGQGDIEVVVEQQGRQVKATLKETGKGLYEASFTPRDAGPHGITVN